MSVHMAQLSIFSFFKMADNFRFATASFFFTLICPEKHNLRKAFYFGFLFLMSARAVGATKIVRHFGKEKYTHAHAHTNVTV